MALLWSLPLESSYFLLDLGGTWKVFEGSTWQFLRSWVEKSGFGGIFFARLFWFTSQLGESSDLYKDARWWQLKYFFMFSPIWGRCPIWLIFFRWVETTNKYTKMVFDRLLHGCCFIVPRYDVPSDSYQTTSTRTSKTTWRTVDHMGPVSQLLQIGKLWNTSVRGASVDARGHPNRSTVAWLAQES